MASNKHILVDLERSVTYGRLYYWNPNKMGYTTSIEHAGIYMQEVAEELVAKDVDNRTIAINLDVIDNITN